jgi:hypothetical protein
VFKSRGGQLNTGWECTLSKAVGLVLTIKTRQDHWGKVINVRMAVKCCITGKDVLIDKINIFTKVQLNYYTYMFITACPSWMNGFACHLAILAQGEIRCEKEIDQACRRRANALA